jgi:hypothetical protein
MSKSESMLEAQRYRAHFKGRLMAEGLSTEDAAQVAREEFTAFRPAFVNGRRRQSDAASSLIRAEDQRRKESNPATE